MHIFGAMPTSGDTPLIYGYAPRLMPTDRRLAEQWRIQGEIPGCHGSPLSVYSYVALVQLLASYISVFVAIVV